MEDVYSRNIQEKMSIKYDPVSSKAEEFINHDEILRSLGYAEKNREN